MADFVEQPSSKSRNDPLGPVTLNQAQSNIEVVNDRFLREHFANGEHNALEVPWIVGHITSGTTGYLFDTGFGGGTIARPATGRVTLDAVAGVIGTIDTPTTTSAPAASIIANVSDADIANKPYVVEAELVSATSIELRTRYLSTALGSPGSNTWSTVAAAVDVAVHAQKRPVDSSALGSHLLKQRRDYLTNQSSDWNALVQNQGTVRAALSLEHVPDETLTTFPGDHLVDRIAKASGLFVPAAGPTYSAAYSKGTGSVSRISTGIIEVSLNEYTFASSDLAACFAQAQPEILGELVIINGRCTAAGTFRFYIYAWDSDPLKLYWYRADRAFYASMFARPA